MEMFRKENRSEFMLAILFIIYLIMGYRTPQVVASAVDTVLGKVVIFAVVIMMFLHSSPILAVLALFVAFDLMRRSSAVTGIDALQQYAPTEAKKSSQFTALNQFPYTLEQEVVKKMAPIIQSGSSLGKAEYSPLLENLHDASPLH